MVFILKILHLLGEKIKVIKVFSNYMYKKKIYRLTGAGLEREWGWKLSI